MGGCTKDAHGLQARFARRLVGSSARRQRWLGTCPLSLRNVMQQLAWEGCGIGERRLRGLSVLPEPKVGRERSDAPNWEWFQSATVVRQPCKMSLDVVTTFVQSFAEILL